MTVLEDKPDDHLTYNCRRIQPTEIPLNVEQVFVIEITLLRSEMPLVVQSCRLIDAMSAPCCWTAMESITSPKYMVCCSIEGASYDTFLAQLQLVKLICLLNLNKRLKTLRNKSIDLISKRIIQHGYHTQVP